MKSDCGAMTAIVGGSEEEFRKVYHLVQESVEKEQQLQQSEEQSKPSGPPEEQITPSYSPPKPKGGGLNNELLSMFCNK